MVVEEVDAMGWSSVLDIVGWNSAKRSTGNGNGQGRREWTWDILIPLT